MHLLHLWRKTFLLAFWLIVAALPALAQLERVVAESRGIL